METWGVEDGKWGWLRRKLWEGEDEKGGVEEEIGMVEGGNSWGLRRENVGWLRGKLWEGVRRGPVGGVEDGNFSYVQMGVAKLLLADLTQECMLVCTKGVAKRFWNLTRALVMYRWVWPSCFWQILHRTVWGWPRFLGDLTQDCMELMKSCVPETLNWNTSRTLTGALSESVCSYLTCKKYFDVSNIQEEEPVAMPYVVLTVLLSIGLIIYYCVAVNYFWLDTFSDVYDSDDHMDRHPESLFPSELPKVPKRTYVRKKPNIIQTEASAGRQDIFNVRAGLETTVQSVPNTDR
ncbi:uncharacterized protein LOC123536150 [Mercenaria mercenaria]|uniref:uncharacterized protein LOC123536150 n=1 Tax=Mercenaria mercenaria TaxID=6596 RepID=UPI00234F8E7E|nr:uncharacterized protein LOC123536150 [Mercenaria mercenaria]